MAEALLYVIGIAQTVCSYISPSTCKSSDSSGTTAIVTIFVITAVFCFGVFGVLTFLYGILGKLFDFLRDVVGAFIGQKAQSVSSVPPLQQSINSHNVIHGSSANASTCVINSEESGKIAQKYIQYKHLFDLIHRDKRVRKQVQNLYEQHQEREKQEQTPEYQQKELEALIGSFQQTEKQQVKLH